MEPKADDGVVEPKPDDGAVEPKPDAGAVGLKTEAVVFVDPNAGAVEPPNKGLLSEPKPCVPLPKPLLCAGVLKPLFCVPVPKLLTCTPNPFSRVGAVAPKLGAFAFPNEPNDGDEVDPNPADVVELDPKPLPLAVVVFAPNEKTAAELDPNEEVVVVVLFPNGLLLVWLDKPATANPPDCVVAVPPKTFVELFAVIPKGVVAPKTFDDVVETVLKILFVANVPVVPPNGELTRFCPNVDAVSALKVVPTNEAVDVVVGVVKFGTVLLLPKIKEPLKPPCVGAFTAAPKPPKLEESAEPKLGVVDVLVPKTVDVPKPVGALVDVPKPVGLVHIPKLLEVVTVPKLGATVTQPKPVAELLPTKTAEDVLFPKLADGVTPPKADELVVFSKLADVVVPPKPTDFGAPNPVEGPNPAVVVVLPNVFVVAGKLKQLMDDVVILVLDLAVASKFPDAVDFTKVLGLGGNELTAEFPAGLGFVKIVTIPSDTGGAFLDPKLNVTVEAGVLLTLLTSPNEKIGTLLGCDVVILVDGKLVPPPP